MQTLQSVLALLRLAPWKGLQTSFLMVRPEPVIRCRRWRIKSGHVPEMLQTRSSSVGRAGARLVNRNREITVLSLCAAAAIGYFAYLVLRPSNGSPKRR